MMVAGTYVLTDTIDRSFEQIFTQSNEGLDAIVTKREVIETDDGQVPPFSEGILTQVRETDGRRSHAPLEDRVAEGRDLAVVGLDHLALGDDRVDALVRLGEDLLERAVDGVGEHVGAGDHHHPEHDRQRGQDRAELALPQVSQRDRAHPESTCFIRSSTCSGVSRRSSRTISPSTRTSTRSAIAAAVGVVGDHDHRLAELVDRAAQQRQHLLARVRVEVAGRLVGEHHRRLARAARGRSRPAAAGRRRARRAGGRAGRRARPRRSAPRAARGRDRGRRASAAA